MEKLISVILKILLAPIVTFWRKVETYKECGEYGKMVAAFVASLFLVLSMASALIVVLIFLFNYHIEVLIIIGIIAWIYWIVKEYFFNKKDNNSPPPSDDPNEYLIHVNAMNGYSSMRTIVFKILRESATHIGAKVPQILQDIEVMTDKYIYANNIVYYQFRVAKQNLTQMSSSSDLCEFNSILQSTFKNLWKTGKFSHIALQEQVDKYGNVFDPITIYYVEDLGNEFLIQTCYTTQAYIDLLHSYWQEQNASQSTDYDTNDSRLL